MDDGGAEVFSGDDQQWPVRFEHRECNGEVVFGGSGEDDEVGEWRVVLLDVSVGVLPEQFEQ
jgi:hypothetical protein